jgi:hypothetical protein
MSEDFGTVEASRDAEGNITIHRADDVIEVTGELAQMFGVNPPLDGRVEFTPGLAYDLAAWSGTGMPGRQPGTYLGRKVPS